MADLLFEVKDHIATITLNRPEAYNAFSEEMITETKIREKEFKTFGRLASNEFISEFKNVP